jgi:hypothetical protein
MLDAGRTDDGVRLRWAAAGATSYAVYRVDGSRPPGRCDTDDATFLVGTVRDGRGHVETFVDETAERGSRYTYVVTALDRSHNESRPSLPRFVR